MHVLKPLIALHLRVDVEGPTEACGHKDTILSGKIVGWKTESLPFSCEDLACKEVTELEVLGHLNFFVKNFLNPLSV
jgi:hypothetical protein